MKNAGLTGYAKTNSFRDYRIDFLRGLALLTIFVNHVRGNFYEKLTHKNFGFSDAAEIFVLLAGVSAALAFYPKYVPGKYQETGGKILDRITSLYSWHIGSSIFVISLFVCAGVVFSNGSLLREINIGPIIDNPIEGFAGLFMLTHQLGYFNILPMYIVLLASLPVIMSLYRVDVKLLLATSIGLYALSGFLHIDLPNFPNQGGWFFNPLSWQLIYVIGFIGYLHVRNGASIPYNKYAFWTAAAYLVIAALWVQFGWWRYWSYFTLNGAIGSIWGFDKTYVSLPRLMHILALAYVFVHSPLPGYLKKVIGPENSLVLIGRHALHLFCFGSVLSMVMLIMRVQIGGGIVLDTVLISSGIALHIALAVYLSRTPKAPSEQNKLIKTGLGPHAT